MIPRAQLVDVCPAVQKRHSGFHVSFPGGVDQSRETTLASHIVTVPEGCLWRPSVLLLRGVLFGGLHRARGPCRSHGRLHLPGVGLPPQIAWGLFFLEGSEDLIAPSGGFPVRAGARRNINGHREQ